MTKIKLKMKKGILIGILISSFSLLILTPVEAKFWGKSDWDCYNNEFGQVCCRDVYRLWIKWKTECK